MLEESVVAHRGGVSSAFVYHWLLWFLLSLPFIVITITDRISRAHAGWFLTNIHYEQGILNLVSGLLCLSQPVFAVAIYRRLRSAAGTDALTLWILLALSSVACLALFLAVAAS
jgi:uncharacterized membrane protein YbhN (UPF0104 family)